MRVFVQDVVLGKVYYLACLNVFHIFAWHMCEENRAVVGCLVLLYLLEY